MIDMREVKPYDVDAHARIRAAIQSAVRKGQNENQILSNVVDEVYREMGPTSIEVVIVKDGERLVWGKREAHASYSKSCPDNGSCPTCGNPHRYPG